MNEHLDEYERFYLMQRKEQDSGERQQSEANPPGKTSESPRTQECKEHDPTRSTESRSEQEHPIRLQTDTYQGMFQSAEKVMETPAARMRAAFDELETLLDDVVSR